MKKWRNKITGEISEFMVHKRIEDSEDGNPVLVPFDGNIDCWEEYEEDELLFYVISAEHERGYQYVLKEAYPEMCKVAKELGIGFETEKECQKAVEKLKAWKRLKDKGFRFIPEASHVEQTEETGESMMFIACTMNDYRDFVFGDNADIKLLFGGEE